MLPIVPPKLRCGIGVVRMVRCMIYYPRRKILVPPIITSIFDIFRIGPGPSSSHTIGPMEAAFRFRRLMEELPDEKLQTATHIEVHLYGSLSATGKGHGTDRAVTAGLLGWRPETCDTKALSTLLDNKTGIHVKIKNFTIPFSGDNIHFDEIRHSFPFSNTIILRLKSHERTLTKKEYYSIGGGFLRCKDEPEPKQPRLPYAYSNMAELKKILNTENISLDELILRNEKAVSGKTRTHIFSEIEEILSVMERSVETGIKTKGKLPGPIGLARKASELYKKGLSLKNAPDRFLVLLNAYAMATAEENAAGHLVVTAPTSGSSGVIPGVLYLLKHDLKKSTPVLRKGLLAAAAIGFIAKHNASISGAEVGCQGEIGVASSMAAALLAHVNGQTLERLENAAEIALEHHLGMTCDPVKGYVQIPCIERNAVAAVQAYDAYLMASTGDPEKQKISLDEVIEAMLETGRDMSKKYKETSDGGLAVCAISC